MRSQYRTLSLALALVLSACATRQPEPRFPREVPLVTRAMWGAKPPVLPMREHKPARLTIHHTGTAQNPSRSLEDKLRGLQAFSQRDDSLASGAKKPAWPDVPYHYYVSTDGRVGEGREWRYVGDTNTSYDPTGHLLLVVEGSFDKDSLTTAQRRTLEVLVPSLARSFGIPAERLASHKDFATTDCPGKALYDLLPHYRALIAGTTDPEPPATPVIQHAYADLSEVRLHYASVGAGDLIMFVHGFPEFWYAWRNQLAEFGKDHRAVAVDMRGYNLSSKPASVDQYAMIHLVQDLAELADKLGHEKFTLVAHDWGGVIAWSFAM